jgi:hypothetical protein
MARQSHQHRRHSRPRRFRRRGRAHTRHGRRRGAAGRCRRRADAADQVRDIQGAGAGAAADRAAQQGGQARGRARPGTERGVRPVCQSRCRRRTARLSRALFLGHQRLGRCHAGRGAARPGRAVRTHPEACAGPGPDRPGRRAVPHAGHDACCRSLSGAHPDRSGGKRPAARRRDAQGARPRRQSDRELPRLAHPRLPRAGPAGDRNRRSRRHRHACRHGEGHRGRHAVRGEVDLPLPAQPIDPPTISVTFGINDSPLAGRDGRRCKAG